MPRQQVGLRFHVLRKFPLQDFADAMMQLPPLAAQQSAVSNILHQRVLEGICRVGRISPPEDQFGVH